MGERREREKLSEAEMWAHIRDEAGSVMFRLPQHAEGALGIARQHVREIHRTAVNMLRQVQAGIHTNPSVRRNPPLMVVGNPPRSDWSEHVESIRYKHQHDGQWYQHDFDKGAALRANRDGSVTIYRRDGRPVWEEFPV